MDLSFYIILGLGVFLGFYIHTIIGFASALIAIPILLYVMEIKYAVSFISLYFFLFSIIQVYKSRKEIQKNIVFELFIPIVIGLVLGIWILKMGSPLVLKKVLGIFIVCFIFYNTLKKKKIKFFNKIGYVFGFIGGIFSGMFSTGGPLYVTYLFNKIKNGKILRATIIGVLSITDFIRLPILYFNGLITSEILHVALVLLPVFFLAIFLGNKTVKLINHSLLKQIVLVVLFISAISLIFG